MCVHIKRGKHKQIYINVGSSFGIERSTKCVFCILSLNNNHVPKKLWHSIIFYVKRRKEFSVATLINDFLMFVSISMEKTSNCSCQQTKTVFATLRSTTSFVCILIFFIPPPVKHLSSSVSNLDNKFQSALIFLIRDFLVWWSTPWIFMSLKLVYHKLCLYLCVAYIFHPLLKRRKLYLVLQRMAHTSENDTQRDLIKSYKNKCFQVEKNGVGFFFW